MSRTDVVLLLVTLIVEVVVEVPKITPARTDSLLVTVLLTDRPLIQPEGVAEPGSNSVARSARCIEYDRFNSDLS
jgi:hypothetical protein